MYNLLFTTADTSLLLFSIIRSFNFILAEPNLTASVPIAP